MADPVEIASARVPILDDDGRFPDAYAPPSVAANVVAAQTARTAAETARTQAQEAAAAAALSGDPVGAKQLIADEILTPGTPANTGLSQAYDQFSEPLVNEVAGKVTAAESPTETSVGGRKRQVVTGNKHLKGLLILGDGVGTIAPSQRVPIHGNIVLDGDAIAAGHVPGTYGYDKVGFSNNVTMRGDFSGEEALGVNNPHDILGANDFIVTGSDEGDMLGITSAYARIVEFHSWAPDADYGTANAFSAQMEVSSGGHADNAYTTYLHPPLARDAGTIDKGYNLYLRKPSADAPAQYWSLFSEGKVEFADGLKVDGAAGTLPGSSTTPRGVYVGRGTNAGIGIEFASGTIDFRIALENNRISFSRPGTAVMIEIDQSGNLITTSGTGLTTQGTGYKLATAATQLLGFWGATPVARPTAVTDATDAATVITQLNALLARLRTIGLIAA
ncbi:hypothetical protein [Microbacterium rhizophilus]|uniref:hypothetical protein n=1 Tax=Microbacterium rhizophilus TaxID=3138934 RepID=UPI0031EC932C